MSNLDVWYARIDVDEIAAVTAERATAKQRKAFERNVAKARSKDSMRALAKLTEVVDGELRIVSDPPLIVPIEDIATGIAARGGRATSSARVIRSYRRTLTSRPPAAARALPLRPRRAQGRRRRQRRHARVDRAHARPRRRAIRCSCSSRRRRRRCSSRSWARARSRNHGQRVVEGQRLTQAASDIMLGWVRVTGLGRREPRLLHPPALGRQGLGSGRADGPDGHGRSTRELCGQALAKAHARSGDAIAIASYLGGGDSFDRAHGVVRRALRRPERARLRRPCAGPPPPASGTCVRRR